jgi:imidazolonepropionase-like amidohydrolase
VPKGARVIELKGLHIYPGMIDSATEIGLTEIEAVREMSDISDIGLFKPQLRAAAAVNPASEHIPVTRANGITSVITSPGGGIVAGQSVLMHLNGWTIEDMAVRAPAAMRMEFPQHPDAESFWRFRERLAAGRLIRTRRRDTNSSCAS